MNSNKRSNVKLCAAAVGGSALVAFGIVNVLVAPPSDGRVDATGATVGAITTTTQAPAGPTEEAVMKAAPEMTGKAPPWPGQSPNHIPQ
jgi:hypothetical protein